MRCAVQNEGDVTVFTLEGSIDALEAPELDARVQEELAAGMRQAVLMMAGVDYISSAGLRSVLGIARGLRSRGGAICFVALQPSVCEVLEISGFSAYFKAYDTVDEVRAALLG